MNINVWIAKDSNFDGVNVKVYMLEPFRGALGYCYMVNSQMYVCKVIDNRLSIDPGMSKKVEIELDDFPEIRDEIKRKYPDALSLIKQNLEA